MKSVIDMLCEGPEKSLIPKDAKPFKNEQDSQKSSQAPTVSANKEISNREPLIPTSVALVAPDATPDAEAPLSPQQVPNVTSQAKADPAIAILTGQRVKFDLKKDAAAIPAPGESTGIPEEAQESMVKSTLASMQESVTGGAPAPEKSASAIASMLMAGVMKNDEAPKNAGSLMGVLRQVRGNRL